MNISASIQKIVILFMPVYWDRDKCFSERKIRVKTVPDRRMWAQQIPSTPRHKIGNCVNACVNFNCDCTELKEYNEKENVYVCICVVYWGLGLWYRPNWIHIESGENPRGVRIPEGRVQGANGGQGELVYEQPGIEVDNSCHSWREPSK
jgi:hypothetical protein